MPYSVQNGTDLLVDGYVSRTFQAQPAQRYFSTLFKSNTLPPYHAWISPSRRLVFVVNHVPGHILVATASQRDPPWTIDWGIVSVGTVVPQTMWEPQSITDRRQHVEEAELQMPIFFIRTDGTVGISLEDAASGRCDTLFNARSPAPLAGRTTTHIRIAWLGYKEFKRQVQIRDETAARNPVTISKFAQHVGRSVVAFLNSDRQLDQNCSDPRCGKWRIDPQGGLDLQPKNLIVIGAVHVSAGSWMPILQLNRFVY
ncbi:hypothetical protein BC834DRAFT_109823 [Gloeopeniophorella convolvens]|nr:hypothetical protein BC834DRAFT_109823 [Gloeopeniophorella convolvens]